MKNLTEKEMTLINGGTGVQVSTSSGALGAPVTVRVRGVGSVNSNSQPLYIVDGVPITQIPIGLNDN